LRGTTSLPRFSQRDFEQTQANLPARGQKEPREKLFSLVDEERCWQGRVTKKGVASSSSARSIVAKPRSSGAANIPIAALTGLDIEKRQS